MGTRETWFAVLTLLAAAHAGAEERHYAVRLAHEATAGALARVLDGAAARLTEPRCQRVFDEFVDGEGRPLRGALERAGVDAPAWLTRLVFYDGSTRPACRLEGIYAVTNVGSRIVWICPEQFREVARKNPTLAEMVLIHEALHSLGLEENPPSSREITARVVQACRR